ncbi:hypothetical protein V7068_00020 [Bacillus sp. JJ634]
MSAIRALKNKIQEEGAFQKVSYPDFLALLFICSFLFKVHWNTIFGEMKAAALRCEEKTQSMLDTRLRPKACSVASRVIGRSADFLCGVSTKYRSRWVLAHNRPKVAGGCLLLSEKNTGREKRVTFSTCFIILWLLFGILSMQRH